MASSSRMHTSSVFSGPSRQSSLFAPMTGEFTVEVEMFLSRTAFAAIKSSLTRTKAEKRDSLRHASSSSDLGGQRSVLKDAASRLGMSRSTEETDQWRPATIKLWEQEQGCFLHVYRDNTALHQAIYVHTLNHTDIRPVHRSLFDSKHCLGIFYSPSQVAMNHPGITEQEPLILRFPDEELLQLWMAFLRSYGNPEVYGRGLNKSDGGLYRMWRQVDVQCVQARNLKSLINDETGEVMVNGVDAFCTFTIDGIDVGRTTVRKSLGSPEWYEIFTFTDLPPFEALEVTVWDKKGTKSVMVGSTVIPLMNFRRGDQVEGWFPVLDKSCMVIGDIKLRIRVDEEIILPQNEYSGVLQALEAKNYLTWIPELETKLGAKGFSDHILEIALCKKKLVENITELAELEIQSEKGNANSLFRGNTTLTKCMESYMHIRGAQWLEASIGPTLRRFCSEKIVIETDSQRLGLPPSRVEKAVDHNNKLLVDWCLLFLKSIYEARDQCPDDLRQLFQYIRSIIEQHFEGVDQVFVYQCLSSFVFLRFFAASIMTPHLRGFWPGLTDDRVRRSLTLITRALQSLANLNKNVSDERGTRVKDYLAQNADDMINYLQSISSPRSGTMPPPSFSPESMRARKKVKDAVRRRLASLPVLYREAIPLPPDMIDLSRALAIVTSVVVRTTRRNLLTRLQEPSELELNALCSQCLAVEEQALSRVSKLAKRNRAGLEVTQQPFIRTPVSPVKPDELPGPRRRTRSKLRKQRPATAPDDGLAPMSPTRSETTLQSIPSTPGLPKKPSFYESFSDPEPSMPPSMDHSPGGEVGRAARPGLSHHSRSASTDSAFTHRSNYGQAASPTMTAACLPFSNDIADNARKKSLLRIRRK